MNHASQDDEAKAVKKMVKKRIAKAIEEYEKTRANPGGSMNMQGKENVVADALSRKERLKPRRVRAMSITIHCGFKAKILEALGKASKDLKDPAEWLRGLETYFERRDDCNTPKMARIGI
nr:putative reverse transcriptase domain-containing protein [Tanacetum cinerariifolium]GEV91178.1 putative reverse transcriptase domain-containing protein [Tanacetum cinerariifolium]